LILLAEDNKIQAKLISMVLHRYNFDIEVAPDGKIALDMFRSNPKYDLILMVTLIPCLKNAGFNDASNGWTIMCKINTRI
jgi:two-component system sensor histidine kinase BarA